MPAAELGLGDCFYAGGEVPGAASGQVGTTVVVACAERHRHEVFFLDSLDEAPAPPDASEISTWAQEHCTPAFERYVGRSVGGSSLTFEVYYPDLEGWISGNRVARCVLRDRDLKELTGSMKGANR